MMHISRMLNAGLVGLNWIALTILVTITGAFFLIAVWQAFDPDERLKRFHASGDFRRIEEWAQQGNIAAEFWMGVIRQERGHPDEAIEWYLRAAAKQDLRAIGRLAALHREKNDLVERIRWLRRGTELGDLGLQAELARAYRHGLGVPRDDREAFRLFHGVAMSGSSEASLVVAGMYDRGDGTDRDPVVALAWVTIAESRLIDSAAQTVPRPVCTLRNELVAELSPEQIARATQKARELDSGMRAATGPDPCAPRAKP